MDLSTQNSWWNPGGLWQDKDLSVVKQATLKYRPSPIAVSDAQSNAIFTLRGPRRAGKTVTLKLLIADLIEKQSIDPKTIVWSNLETIRNISHMENHLIELIQNKKPKFLFLDEVTAIRGWQKVIKKFRDDGQLSYCSIFLTGSSAYDLKAGSERMAGRKGSLNRTDHVLLPMSYVDFKSALHPFEVTVEDYLCVGGFPYRVTEFKKTRTLNQQFDPMTGLNILDDVFFYEINRRKLDRNIALEILFRLSVVGVTAISYESFAKKLSLTNDTAKKYLNLLGDAYLLATVYSYDHSHQRVALKKNKKFMWIDPALHWLAAFVRQGEPPKIENIVESTVCRHLLGRFEDRLFEGISAPRNVFTWKSKAGNEVDFLIVDRSKKLKFPIEVKYQNQISASDFLTMERAFGHGLIISKAESIKRPLSTAVSLSDFLSESSGVYS